MDKLVMHNVYLTKKQIEWLRRHQEFNFSGWTRVELAKKMQVTK